MWNLLAGFAGVVSVGQQAFVGLGAYSMIAFVNVHGQNLYWSVPLSALVAGARLDPDRARRLPPAGQLLRDRHVGARRGGEPHRDPTDESLGAGNGVSLKVAGYDLPTRQDVTLLVGARRGRRLGPARPTWSCGRVSVCRCRPSATTRRAHEGWAPTCTAPASPIWVLAAFWTGFGGAVFYLQQLRVQPTDEAFSVVQWTAPIIFIVVIGGIGTIEGPIIGAVLYYFLRDDFNDYETAYIIGTGVVAMVVALWVQPGIWGHIRRRLGADLFPLRRRLVRGP